MSVSMLFLLLSIGSSAAAFTVPHPPKRKMSVVRCAHHRRICMPAGARGRAAAAVLYAVNPSPKQQGGIELGIQTAQMLLNDKRRDQLKDSVARKFPLVPGSVIDSAIAVVATAFKTVAPETLKQALQPGGMVKLRPVLMDAIVEMVVQQDAVKNIRVLSDADKSKLIGNVVDLALDQLLKDANWALSAPAVRLEALQDEIRLIERTEMTVKQLLLYRFRRHPVRYLSVFTLSCFYLYVQWLHAGSWMNALVALQRGLLTTGKQLGVAGKITVSSVASLSRLVSIKARALIASRWNLL